MGSDNQTKFIKGSAVRFTRSGLDTGHWTFIGPTGDPSYELLLIGSTFYATTNIKPAEGTQLIVDPPASISIDIWLSLT